MEQRIDGSTGLLALIGSPVGHSGSPAMYNFSFRYHKLNYAYLAFDIKEEQVKEAIAALRLLNVRGFNVTMPCKTAVVEYMDELSPAARMAGACNTVVNDNGRLVGHMTDGSGFVLNLKEQGVEVKGKKLVILGAGGAAAAIQAECALEGAEALSIFNGNLEKAGKIAEKIKREVPDCRVRVTCIDDQEALKADIAQADILVNATSVGMKPNEQETLIRDTGLFRPGLVVADAVYNPPVTRMLREAKEAGCTVIGGEGMLLWQGAAAYQLYTGLAMPTDEYRRDQAALITKSAYE